MQGASRSAAAAVEQQLLEVLRGDRDPAARRRLAESLFEVTALLDSQAALRRTLGDPSTEPQRRTALVDALFGNRLDRPVLDLLRSMAGERWSVPRDLVDTLDRLGASAALGAAESAGTIDDVEDQLFRFARILDRDPALRAALSDSTIEPQRKVALVADLLTDRADGITTYLVQQAVRSPRGRTLEEVLADYADLAAQRRDRIVAVARVAVPLTEEQTERMTARLAAVFGREIALQVDVDPAVLGGVEVRVGEEVIDGTVAGRFEQARQGLGGY